MDLSQRKAWNEQHKVLTNMMARPEEHEAAIELFMKQHGRLHSSGVDATVDLNYEDLLLADMQESTFRTYPTQTTGTANSIAWHMWHCTRIEDITLSILVADSDQVMMEGKWLSALHIPFVDTGNGMKMKEVGELSAALDMGSLFHYRQAVGKRTRDIVAVMSPQLLRQKVKAARLQRIRDEQALMADGEWLLDYWKNKKLVGLLLGPATRHNFIHLNKSMRIKNQLQKKGRTTKKKREAQLEGQVVK
ncbi:hypothetical protein [Paenibacillus massiliensis]|uniref:hypothetical protein n=1 Tax=Paenibacillus massiliensis TaxID=225917 RepID=UPI0004703116|nr:hypothetical protein [Paenibacillus massiliensis]